MTWVWWNLQTEDDPVPPPLTPEEVAYKDYRQRMNRKKKLRAKRAKLRKKQGLSPLTANYEKAGIS